MSKYNVKLTMSKYNLKLTMSKYDLKLMMSKYDLNVTRIQVVLRLGTSCFSGHTFEVVLLRLRV